MKAALLDSSPRGVRNARIDALPVSTTLLVVLHHTAITYGAIGGWYYKEMPTGDSLSSMLLVFFCTLNQAWFMGLFFLLAGYYTPAALEAGGSWHYLRNRLQRLGILLIVYGFVIGPATIALAQTARGNPSGTRCLGCGGKASSKKVLAPGSRPCLVGRRDLPLAVARNRPVQGQSPPRCRVAGEIEAPRSPQELWAMSVIPARVS